MLCLSTPAFAMIGGIEIPRSTHPESVHITAMGAQCTGTLIAPQFILTAAHCLEKIVSGHPSFVRLVQVYWDEKRSSPIDRYFIHPTEDLALLELSTPSPITPATLVSPQNEDALVPESCSVVGYGTPYNKNGRYQERLDGTGVALKRKGTIKLSGKKDQYFKTKPTRYWTRRLIPFATKDSPVQITHGDSGGPLFCNGKLTGVSIQALESYWIGGGSFFKSQSFFLDLSQPELNQWIRDPYAK